MHMSLQLEQMLLQQSGDSDQQSVYGAEQGWLREEGRSYRLKLQAFQESQHRQAQLVQKLQAKVHCQMWSHSTHFIFKMEHIPNYTKASWFLFDMYILKVNTLELQNHFPPQRFFPIFDKLRSESICVCSCSSIRRDVEIQSSRCWRKPQSQRS